jgi:catechol 2,3-dioxygenase-like lactoylglutathione lyase family enzyme
MELDSVQIGVADLSEAAGAYQLLLGIAPGRATGGGCRFQLQRGAVELDSGQAGLHAITFVSEPETSVPWPSERAAFHGLDVRVAARGAWQRPALAAAGTAIAIDHVVVHTCDLERATTLWRDRLGVRLALDREFPARGLRMCFFRNAGITLEFVTSLPPPLDRSEPDRLYGIAYRVVDLGACHHRLQQAGLDVSRIRPGHKPGTSVATVRSGTAGVPTLLIENTAEGHAHAVPGRAVR